MHEKGYTALFCVLDCIVQYVHYDLPNPHLISIEPVRELRIHDDLEIKPLLLCLELHHVINVIDHRAQTVSRLHDYHLPGLDF